MNVLTLNLGSSSLKYAVHEFEDAAESQILARDVAVKPDAQSAAEAAYLAIADAVAAAGRIDAAGHRVVFGADDDAPAPVTSEMLERLTFLAPLDPLHLPGTLAVIRQSLSQLPAALHVACFDTAFFRNMPPSSRVLPIATHDPIVRRYGFHGLSYEFVRSELGDELLPRTIVAHLGNGASAAAILNGEPIDSTMGFSPLSGIVMSTRPGDMDPGVLLYLLERDDITVPQLRDMLETQSGLRAVSGGESDLQRLCERTDELAMLALEVFVRSAAKAIGALATQLGGVDMLVFTGGIGEHNARVREAIRARVSFLNPEMRVRVLSTDENLTIARHTARIALSAS